MQYTDSNNNSALRAADLITNRVIEYVCVRDCACYCFKDFRKLAGHPCAVVIADHQIINPVVWVATWQVIFIAERNTEEVNSMSG